jgi:IclR family mhp operon transcriptional activator
MDERQEVKSLKKALRALTYLNCHGDSTVTEVAVAIGVPRTTSYRLLETLASEGYVEKQPHSNIYRLTSQVQNLSSGFGDCDLFVEVAKPFITQFGLDLRWPLALAIPQGADMMVRIATDHDTSLAIDRYSIGFRTPILHAPAGLCYIAFCPQDARETILDLIRRSDPDSAPLRSNGAALDFTLEDIRQRGFCHIRYAQYREGGLAVPVFAEGRAVGGIVMRYIKSTLRTAQLEEHYVPIVKKLAAEIAEAYAHRLAMKQANPAARPVETGAHQIAAWVPETPFPLPTPEASNGLEDTPRLLRA